MERIELLLGQGRYEMAQEEILKVLAEYPNDPILYGYLGICLLEQDKIEEGKEAIEKSISLQPDSFFGHSLLSRAYYAEGDMKSALKAIDEAIRLNPVNAGLHIHKAYILFSKGEWDASLESALTGLAFDPENVDGLNIRARVLVKLGRSPEASEAFEASMNRNPENAYTHINKGWALLEEGKYDEALKHFKEGVRLDPDNEVARSGLVEGLKAKYWIYRAYLKFAFWLNNMSSRNRWVFMIGLIVVVNYFKYLIPFYLAFIFFSWFSSSIFDLLLRFNTYGKYALSKEQFKNTNIFGGLLFTGLGSLIATAFVNFVPLEFLGFICLGMLFPVVGTFSKRNVASRKKSLYITYGFVALGLATVGFSFINIPLAEDLLTAFAVGIMGYTFFINMIP